jgi:hypothetical protein
MGSIPATPSTKHASCFPPSSMLASIEISIKLIVCLSVMQYGPDCRLTGDSHLELDGFKAKKGSVVLGAPSARHEILQTSTR